MLDKNKKIIIASGVLLLIMGIFGYLFLKNNNITQSSTSFENNTQKSSTVNSSDPSKINFQIISKISKYPIKSESINKDVLIADLTNLGLYPFVNLLYIGEPVNGIWQKDSRTINPSEVDITFYPYDDFVKDSSLKERTIFSTVNDSEPVIVFTAGHLTDDNKFNLPIYINSTQFDLLSKPINSKLSQEILLGIFLNFQSGPLTPSVNYYQLIDDKLGPNISVDLIKVE